MCIFNITHSKKKKKTKAIYYSIYSISLRGEIIIMNLSKCIYPFFLLMDMECCFQFGAVMNNAAMSILASCFFLSTSAYFTVGFELRSRISGSCSIIYMFCCFINNAKQFSKMIV